jgi:CDGSH-type Zn-finger protein
MLADHRPVGPSPPQPHGEATDAAAGKIVVSKNGPYLVSGGIPLQMQTIEPNAQGLSWEWVAGSSFETKGEYHLCRCGNSSHKPFCDGTHARVHFDGTETATRQPYDRQAETTDGPTLTLRDAEMLCAFARFCDPAGKIWGLVPRSGDPEARALAIREEMRCPGGRLVVQDKKTGETIEPVFPPSIGVVEDSALKCSGPLWVRGRIRVESHNGIPYEIRNRIALCRCGASTNKPFCNGSHASIRFQDGLK